jgi:hypothetical protein
VPSPLSIYLPQLTTWCVPSSSVLCPIKSSPGVNQAVCSPPLLPMNVYLMFPTSYFSLMVKSCRFEFLAILLYSDEILVVVDDKSV